MNFKEIPENERDTLRWVFLNTIGDPALPLLIRNKAQYLYDKLRETERELTHGKLTQQAKEQ